MSPLTARLAARTGAARGSGRAAGQAPPLDDRQRGDHCALAPLCVALGPFVAARSPLSSFRSSETLLFQHQNLGSEKRRAELIHTDVQMGPFLPIPGAVCMLGGVATIHQPRLGLLGGPGTPSPRSWTALTASWTRLGLLKLLLKILCKR